MLGPKITTEEIERWAEGAGADSELPRLIRGLLMSHAGAGDRVHFRAGKGTSLPGFDGEVFSETGTRIAPRGWSRWEVSVRKDVQAKANEDFRDRSGDASLQETYFEVTARRWSGKSAWETAQRSTGIWGDVRAIDADDIEAWLEVTPAMACWFAEKIGRPVPGVETLESYLRKWSERTEPELKPSMLLLGRDEEQKRVLDWLRGPPRALSVQVDTEDEAVAFVAATIQSAGTTEEDERALVIHSKEAREWVCVNDRSSVLLTPNHDVLLEGVRGHHRVLPVVARGNAELPLAPLNRTLLADALTESGFDRAEDRARECGGRLRILQRSLGWGEQPAWSRDSSLVGLSTLLLVGGWNPNNSNDAAVIKMFGIDAQDLGQLCERLELVADPPIRRDGVGWRWRSPADAWMHLGARVTPSARRQFSQAVETVLGEEDPQFQLPEAKRYMRNVTGHVLMHSELLRDGLAESLVRLQLSEPDGVFVAGCVAHLLNADWRRWASLDKLLMLLAEASPDSFLQAAERSLPSPSGITQLFHEECHSALLWAIEGIAWLPEHFERAIRLLLRLADRDPGGRTVNRPSSSAFNCMHPLRPQTMADSEARLKFAKHMVRKHPTSGWNLLIALLGAPNGGVLFPSHRPSFRDTADPSAATHAQVWTELEALLEIALRDAQGNPARCASLLGQDRALGASGFARVLDLLESSPTNEPDIWYVVQKPLRAFVGWNTRRSVPSAEWEALVARAAKQLEVRAPVSLALRHSWLFEPSVNEGCWDDWDSHVCELSRLHHAAGTEILSSADRLNVLRQMVLAIPNPDWLGSALGAMDVESLLFSEFVTSTIEEPGWVQLMSAYFRGCGQRLGAAWVAAVFVALWQGSRTITFAKLASVLQPRREYADAVAALGGDAESAYWRSAAPPHQVPLEMLHLALKKLLAVERGGAALESCYSARSELDVGTIEWVLREAANHWSSFAEISDSDLLYVEELFGRIDEEPLEAAQMVSLELRYFGFLRHTTRGTPAISLILTTSPAQFAALVETAFPAEKDPATTHPMSPEEFAMLMKAALLTEPGPKSEAAVRAENANYILESWRDFPADAVAWCESVLKLTRDSGRRRSGTRKVAEVLARMPLPSDKIWPCIAARELLESEPDSQSLADALRIAQRNTREVTSRGMMEGGVQERELRQKYLDDAATLASESPATSAMLRDLAQSYALDAHGHELRADKYRDP